MSAGVAGPFAEPADNFHVLRVRIDQCQFARTATRHHHLMQCRRETEVIETYSLAATGKRLRRQRRQGGNREHNRGILHQPHLAMCAYFTNTQAGFSRGNAIIPTAAVAATSRGLLTFQRKSTNKLTSAITAVSQSPMAILPSRTAAPRIVPIAAA